jgi:hypothetical protein
MIGVVPLNPTIYGAASDAEVGGDLDDAPSTNICPNGATSSPLAEVVLELGFEDKLVKLFELRGAATRAPNGLPCLGSSHDQVTMILSRSAVKRGSQATRSCLVNATIAVVTHSGRCRFAIYTGSHVSEASVTARSIPPS